MMKRKGHGQSTLEYVILIVILIGVFIAMQNYIKRGFQGRWKSSIDEIGDQYDPAAVNSIINYTQDVQSNSFVQAVSTVDPLGISGNGWVTNRTDTTDSTETKTGLTTIAAP